MREVRCIWPLAAELGEGPIWSQAERALWFVDIKGQRVHRFDPAHEVSRSWPSPDRVSFAVPTADGCLVAGLPGRLARFTPATGEFETLIHLESDLPDNRLNDACADAAGRLWFGSMDNREAKPNGSLYRWDGTGAPVPCDHGFVISNGPIHSPDGRVLYHTDTVRRTIYRFDVVADGSVSGKRPFIEIEDGAGWPDGSTVDAEGCLWVALWGGWAVRRYSPEGDLLEIVRLPCAYVTKVALGGDDLRTAFVTTALKGLGRENLESQPLAGGLFAFEADIPGLCAAPIQLSAGGR
jgi:sugar lactone lactonase YvrE